MAQDKKINGTNIFLTLVALMIGVVIFYLAERKNGGSTFTVDCETSKGPIEIVVDPHWSPQGARRFLQMVEEGFFKDLPLFRCVDGFICQFGAAPPRPDARAYSNISDDPQVPSLRQFKRGYLSFAGSGPNSRSTHLFIALGDHNDSLGANSWETPIGYVTSQSMEQTVKQFTTSYGDMPPWGAGPDPAKIQEPQGAEYLKENFPRLDYIKSCSKRP